MQNSAKCFSFLHDRSKGFLVRVCTRIIRECKLRSPSWIIGPRRVLLKHRRQWNRTKCICVTIGDLCELFRAGTTPVTSGRCGSNRKWGYEGTGACVYMRIYRVLRKKKELLFLYLLISYVSYFTMISLIELLQRRENKIKFYISIFIPQSVPIYKFYYKSSQ